MRNSMLCLLLLVTLTFGCKNNNEATDTTEIDALQTEEIADNTTITPPNNTETDEVSTTQATEVEAPETPEETPAPEIDHPIRPGQHVFTLQWLGDANTPGSATVEYLSAGKYSIEGKQIGEGSDYATIEGVLTYEAENIFQFDGKMVSQVSYVNGGEVCVKDGTYHFRATGSRKYWRLKEKDNCEGNRVVDYFDIYF